MEKEIYLVNAKTSKDKQYYIVEYVDFQNNKNKSLIKSVDEMNPKTFEHIKNKVAPKNIAKVTGIFEINGYDRAELVDVK